MAVKSEAWAAFAFPVCVATLRRGCAASWLRPAPSLRQGKRFTDIKLSEGEIYSFTLRGIGLGDLQIANRPKNIKGKSWEGKTTDFTKNNKYRYLAFY